MFYAIIAFIIAGFFFFGVIVPIVTRISDNRILGKRDIRDDLLKFDKYMWSSNKYKKRYGFQKISRSGKLLSEVNPEAKAKNAYPTEELGDKVAKLKYKEVGELYTESLDEDIDKLCPYKVEPINYFDGAQVNKLLHEIQDKETKE